MQPQAKGCWQPPEAGMRERRILLRILTGSMTLPTPLNSVQQVKAALRLLHGEQQGPGLALTPAPCKFMVSQGHQHHQQWIAPTFKGASSWPPKVCEKDKAGWVHFSV